MLQRVQTVYLVLAIIGFSFPFFGGLATLEIGGKALYEVGVLESVDVVMNSPMENLQVFSYTSIAALALILLGTVYTILMFKNRVLQMKLVRILHLLSLAVIVYWFVMIGNVNDDLSGEVKLATSYSLLFYGPIASIAFLILASKGIKKDQELVDSLDRLR